MQKEKTSADQKQPQPGSGQQSSNQKPDIKEIALRLMNNSSSLPPKLGRYQKYHNDYSKVIGEISAAIDEITNKLTPPTDPESKAENTQIILSATDRVFLRTRKRDLKSILRRLKKEHKNVQRTGKKLAKESSRNIRLIDLKDKVKDPSYYKKHGNTIAPSFLKILSKPMDSSIHKSFSELKSNVSASNFSELLGKFLLWKYPDLYIKATGTPEKKKEYFALFGEALKEWDGSKAEIIKDIQTSFHNSKDNN